VRTVVAYLLRVGQPLLREVMGGGFFVLKNVTQKVHVHLKKNHALFVERFFTHQAFTKTRYRKRVL
jgi:hypothetical protein